MNFKDLVAATRSTRRFDESRTITMAELEELADMARMTQSATNAQPLRHVLITDDDTRAKVCATLGFAGYLPNWPGPDEGEQPAAYIVLCAGPDNGAYLQVDAGIQSQTILLGARSMGFGGCMFGSINREKLGEIIDLPEAHSIVYVIALGVPGEDVIIEELAPGGSIKYWRDADDKHHVPKRTLAETVIGRFGE